MSFEEDLRRFQKKAGVRAELVLRKVGIEVASSLIRKSPVDTGRFRANWITSILAPSSSTTESTDTSGQNAMAAATKQILSAKLGQTIWISNNLPYAQRLEHGHSQQAPAGMVRITVAEWQGYLKQVARQL